MVPGDSLRREGKSRKTQALGHAKTYREPQRYTGFMPSALLILLLIAASGLIAWAIWKAAAQQFLGQMNAGARLYRAKRYTEAAEAFRVLLEHRLPVGLEADTRRRLADTLDVLGQTEEASSERDRAEAAASCGGRDPMALTAQGDLLKKRQQYNEACKAYHQALSLTSPLPSPGRALIMAKLALAHFEAGRSAETVRWAEASLANAPNETIYRMMERIAGVGYVDLGDFERAESHYLRGLKLAKASGKPQEIASSLGLLGSLQHKRGYFKDAIATSRRAQGVAADPSGTALAIEAECLRDMGRFTEARVVMARRRQGLQHDQPDLQRRMLALGCLGSAWIEIYAECYDEALVYLEEAREGLKFVTNSTIWPPPPSTSDSKVGLWCDSAFANALAGAGRVNEAQEMITNAESRLSGFGQDRATRIGTLGSLGRAAYCMGDLAASRTFWEAYLAASPSPVYVPNAYYWLGEIALRLGETDAAHEAFRQSIAPEIDTFYARRAKARLAEIDR